MDPAPPAAADPDPSSDLSIESGSCQAEPLYFASESHSLFGWLHWPRGVPMASVGVVICNPFGYEAICAHRAVRAFAEAAASVGAPALRFDYLGTGDSEDIDPNSDQLKVWSRNVVDAVTALRRRTGVARVVLLGFRLGALIAALAAAEGADATALMAVAPALSGKRYLRELRTIQMAASGNAVRTTDGAQALEVSGFTLSSATVAALSQIEVGNLALGTVEQVLVIDRKELPGARPWVDALTQSAIHTDYVALPGFVRMMMTAPHFSAKPQSMIDAAHHWLQALAGNAPHDSDALGSKDLVPRELARHELRLPCDATFPDAAVGETVVLLSPEPGLFAIVNEPRHGEARRRAVILLNAGATHHVGPNRMFVDLARRWAARGYVVVRMDLAGLGDSGTRPGRPEAEVHPPAALEDIKTAVDFVRSRCGISDITLVGMCSGAYHALRAAAAALPVRRILMVNPLNFEWHESMTLQDLTWLAFVHNPSSYFEQVLPAKFWSKLMRGQVDLKRLVKLCAQHMYVSVDCSVRNAARALHLPLPRDLGYEMEAIAARGTEMVFLFARGEPGIALLRRQGGSSIKRLGGFCRIHEIDGADHIFSQSATRATLEKLLSEELFARQLPLPRGAAPGPVLIGSKLGD